MLAVAHEACWLQPLNGSHTGTDWTASFPHALHQQLAWLGSQARCSACILIALCALLIQPIQLCVFRTHSLRAGRGSASMEDQGVSDEQQANEQPEHGEEGFGDYLRQGGMALSGAEGRLIESTFEANSGQFASKHALLLLLKLDVALSGTGVACIYVQVADMM